MFDVVLNRNIKDGKAFDGLIPKSQCKATFLGNGMTGFSVNQMQNIIEQNQNQTSKVAAKLKKSSLKHTVDAIHDFLYYHFQYKADQEDQLLRSPACSWHDRHNGIDCKSYSIFASSLLLNLGIKHYLRRIKQPGYAPTEYTHVYVVVPQDQKSGHLQNRYYVIDATLKNNVEPAYTAKSDLPMLPHYGLNAPHGQGLGFSTGDIKGLFSGQWSFNCIGGTYDKRTLDTAANNVPPFFANAALAINTAVQNNTNVAQAVNQFLINAQTFQHHADIAANHNWNSSCSRSATREIRNIANLYNNIALDALLKWLSLYYSFQNVRVPKRSNEFNFNSGLQTNWYRDITVDTIANPIRKNVQEIKAFTFSPYLLQNAKDGNQINVLQLIQGAATIYSAVSGNPANPGTMPGGTTQPGGFYDQITPGTQPQQAGFGLLGWVLVAVGLGWAWTKMKDSGPGATRPGTTTKRTPAKRTTPTRK